MEIDVPMKIIKMAVDTLQTGKRTKVNEKFEIALGKPKGMVGMWMSL